MTLTEQQKIKDFNGKIKSIDAKLTMLGEGHKLVPILWGESEIIFGRYHNSTCPKEVIIPPYTEHMLIQSRIVDSAFDSCQGLEEIKIMPKVGVDYFGKSVFQGCINLRKVEILFDLELIPSRTFFNCIKLRDIDLPSSVAIIKENAFSECNSLESVGLKKDSNLRRIDNGAFDNCSSLKTIVLPNTLIKVGDNAFTHSGLIHMQMPNSVKFLGTSAFKNCVALKDVTLPNELVDLPSFCFDNCTELSDVILPQGKLNSIGDYAFNNCQKLDSLVIPEGVQKIGKHAFKGSGIKKLVLPVSLISIDENDFGKNIVIYCKKNSNSSIKRIARREDWNVHWV